MGIAEQTRIDRWLTATRIFKSRTLAQEACEAGHVRVNDLQVKPSHTVKIGDEVRAFAPRGVVVFIVKGLADKRLSAALAQLLYEDRSPPPPPKEERVAVRERGAGRPTKADRRALSRLRGRDG
jgi:ribosome-associated heat shock protein Hsp15